MRSLACWNCGFESRLGHGCLSLVNVLSGRGLCDEPTIHPEEIYRLWCVVMCDLETSRMWRTWPALECCARDREKKTTSYFFQWMFSPQITLRRIKNHQLYRKMLYPNFCFKHSVQKRKGNAAKELLKKFQDPCNDCKERLVL
jgi:hypothetical protein